MFTPVTANHNPREHVPLGIYFRSRSGCLVQGCTHLGQVQPHRSLSPDRPSTLGHSTSGTVIPGSPGTLPGAESSYCVISAGRWGLESLFLAAGGGSGERSKTTGLKRMAWSVAVAHWRSRCMAGVLARTQCTPAARPGVSAPLQPVPGSVHPCSPSRGQCTPAARPGASAPLQPVPGPVRPCSPSRGQCTPAARPGASAPLQPDPRPRAGPGAASGAQAGGSTPRNTSCSSAQNEARAFLSRAGKSSANALPTGGEAFLPSRLPPEGRSSLRVIQSCLKGAARSGSSRGGQAGGTSYPWAPGAGHCPFNSLSPVLDIGSMVQTNKLKFPRGSSGFA
ncbi:hypothetical protein NN561_000068 [Cricetulus griseus]